jgi:uncharacterized protein with FMN-binding domain
MPKKLPGRLVALSASAVATIYAVGVLSTHSAAESLAMAADSIATPDDALSVIAANPTSTPDVVVGASATATATPTSSTATSTASYADGTYSGTATSRFGSVTVAVTTAGGAITNVQITKVSTTFPVSQIASLPAHVVQNQSDDVNAVTGATYSSQAFKQAVQQALDQALAANAATAAA